MIYEDVEQELIQRLGPTSDLRIARERDFLRVSWDSASISLAEFASTGEPPVRQHAIGFDPGEEGSKTELAYLLPWMTPFTELTDALITEIRRRRHTIPAPSPYRWGSTRRTWLTDVADAMAAHPATTELDAQVEATLNRSGLTVSAAGTKVVLLPGQRERGMLALGPTQGDLLLQPRLRVAGGTDAILVASAALAWLIDPVDRGGYSPDLHGLTAGDRLDDVCQALDAVDLNVVRVDPWQTRMHGSAQLHTGSDVITVMDAQERVGLLVRGRIGGSLPLWMLCTPADEHDGRGVRVLPRPFAPDDDPRWGGASLDLDDAATSAQDVAAAALAGLEWVPVHTGYNYSDLLGPDSIDGVIAGMRITEAQLLGLDQPRPRPEPFLIRSPHDAELVAATWMRWMGFADAQATPVGTDEGIDVWSSDAVAQVKTETLPIGRPALQRLYGAAHAEGCAPLFFSLSGYTAQAMQWGERVGMALFAFDLQGEPVALSGAAESLMD